MIVALASLALAGCGHTGRPAFSHEGVNTSVADYLRGAPTSVTDIDQNGPIVKVSCSAMGEHYRAGAIFVCSIRHTDGTEDEWCVAMVNGKLITQFDDPGVPCTGFPSSPDLQPRMEGPQ